MKFYAGSKRKRIGYETKRLDSFNQQLVERQNDYETVNGTFSDFAKNNLIASDDSIIKMVKSCASGVLNNLDCNKDLKRDNFRRLWRCAYCTLDIIIDDDENVTSSQISTASPISSRETRETKNVIVGCPIDRIVDLSSDNSTNSFVTFGSFCSLRCAKAYAISNSNKPIFRDSCRYIDEMNQFNFVKPSPDIFLMSSFGGTLTENQYRQLIKQDRVSISTNEIRMFPVTINYEIK